MEWTLTAELKYWRGVTKAAVKLLHVPKQLLKVTAFITAMSSGGSH